jgi:hypothetical protein
MTGTPVGDWLRRRYPPNAGATHYLGAGGDPGCCAGPHPMCTYEAARRETLAEFASELDDFATDVLKVRITWAQEIAAPVIAEAITGIARMARERAGRPHSGPPAGAEVPR